MTWWNINYGAYKRQVFWTIDEQYRGKAAPCATPKIKRFALIKANGLKENEIIAAEVEMSGDNMEEYSYEYRVSTAIVNVIKYYVNDFVEAEVVGGGPKAQIKVPGKPGVYRVYCFVKDKNGNLSGLNKIISVGEKLPGTEH